MKAQQKTHPKATPKPNDTATALYGRQNICVHKALGDLGLMYMDNRRLWSDVMTAMFKRPVASIKELTLGERSQFISHLIGRGARGVVNPWVPNTMARWRNGDAEVTGIVTRPLRVPHEKMPTVKKIGAILAELRKPWSYADGIAQQSHGVQYVEWLEYEDLREVMQMLVVHQRRGANGGRMKENGKRLNAKGAR